MGVQAPPTKMNDHFEWFETLRIRKWPVFDHFRDHFEKLRFFSSARSFWTIILKNHFFSVAPSARSYWTIKSGCQNYGNNTVLVEFVRKTNWKFGKLHCRNHVCVGLFVKNPFALSKMLFIAFTPPFKQNFTQTYRENLSYCLPQWNTAGNTPFVGFYELFFWRAIISNDHFEKPSVFLSARSFCTIILKNLFFFRRAFGAIILCGWSF